MSLTQALLVQSIGYLGKKAFKTDTLYGTGLSWVPGQVQQVPAQIAQQMHIKHPDVYALETSERWEQFKEGTLKTTVVVPDQVITADTKINELVAQLGIELTKLQNKGAVAAFPLVEKLGVTFGEQDTRPQMQEAIQNAYRANLQANPDRVDEVYQAKLGAK